MSSQDSDGEADSLFGSPPPSPSLSFVRGGSPELALPGSQTATCAILPDLPKNVGTIALPGSHNRSELSDSLPAHTPTPQMRQPALPVEPQQPQYRFEFWEGPRATSVAPTDSRRVKTHEGSKPKKATPVMAHAQPALPLGINLPPNFLRYHQELLGLAGVAGGVSLVLPRHDDSRGRSKENPIVVEDEPTSQNISPCQTQPPTNAPPNSQAIADNLVAQGTIFPVLRSLMPYLGLNANAGCCPNVTPYQYQGQKRPPSNITAPPLKRRKLNSVPAGAKDWDVPYPFAANEGPKNYLESWKKKRGKKLMMQLVSLVREAVQKATAKTQVKNSTSVSSVAEPPAVDTTPKQVSTTDDDALMAELQSLAAPLPATSPSEQEAMFSDFFTPSATSMDPTWSFSSDFDSLLGAVNSALSDPNAQLVGNDLDMMSSYPFSPTLSSSSTLSSSTRLPTPSDFGAPSLDSKDGEFPDFSFDDIPLDSSLLDFSSWPGDTQPAAHTSTELTQTGGVPPSGTGELGIHWQQNEVTFDQGDAPAIEVMPDPSTTIADGQTDVGLAVPQPTGEEPSRTQDGDTRSLQPPPPLPPLPPPSDVQPPQPPLQLCFRVPPADAENDKRGGSGSSTKKPNREEVLPRARVRREQLAAELARAKIELWETTIEQGVLTHLSKDKNLHSKP